MFFNSFFRYFLYLTGTKFILAPDYLQNEQEKYDKMMKKAREKALKRAVELGALTEEDMELYGSGKKEEQASADRGAETCT